jgi:hypothetical protein
MSQQQVQRLQSLLETVQRNRQRPGEPMGVGSNVAAANVVQKKSPANMTAEPTRPRVPTPDLASAQAAKPAAAEPARARVPTPDLAAKPAAPAPRPAAPQAQPQQREAAAQPPATQPKSAPRIPEPQAAAPQAVVQEPIVPRVIEPEAQRPATRPIAQLVSKHAPVVDATFGAMLKRSLSLRPH